MAAGKRLIVSYLDELAFLYPNKLWALLPNTDNPRDGFRDITYACLKNAIDYCAWHLEAKLGRSSTFETYTFLSHPLDIRYQILTIAAIKIGWNAFFSSPRNSLEAHLSLLEQARCNVWLVGESADPIVDKICAQRPMKLVDIPTLDFLLSNNLKVPHYGYNKTFEQARLDPCMVLHTSGSTGTPKVVVCKHTLFTVFDAYNKNEHANFHWSHFRGMKAFLPFPNFHMAGLSATLGACVFFDVVTVLSPWKFVTAEMANAYHQYGGVDVSILPASILKELAGSETYTKNLANLKYIGNSAGPVSEELGAALNQYCHPVNLYGITETSVLGTLMLSPEDWQYIAFSDHAGAEMRPVSKDFWELFIVRKQGMRDYQHIFSTFPDLPEWPTRDLFSQHPTNPNLWLLVGRVDDVIVFNNGEKHNPVTFEQDVSNLPLVTGAVVFGQGRFQAGLLLETASSDVDVEDVIEAVWSTVQRLNNATVAHGRVAKDMILVSSPAKAFPRAGKGTVQRRPCLNLYADEINELYLERENQPNGKNLGGLSVTNEVIAKRLERWIAETLCLPCPGRDEDLFNSGIGFDSLTVMRFVRFVNQTGLKTIKAPVVYDHPTINKLAAFIGGSEDQDERASKRQRLDALFQKFNVDMPLN